jgi:hypothetical protein
VFDGDRSKAESFVDQLNTYFRLNHQVESYQSFLTRITLALTLVQGPLVQEWGRHMGEWLDDRLAFEDNRDTWTQFTHQFLAAFADTQRDQRA